MTTTQADEAKALSAEELAEIRARQIYNANLTPNDFKGAVFAYKECRRDRVGLLVTIAQLTAEKAELRGKVDAMCDCLEWEQERAEAAEAKLATVVEACTTTRAYEGALPTVIEHRCKLCYLASYREEPLHHAPDCVLADPPTALTAQQEKLKRLEENQRTPGTVEVCESCGDILPIKVCERPGRDYAGERWEYPCPFKHTASSEGK